MTLTTMHRAIHTLLLACLLTGNTWAELYKWVDEQGRTHYSDSPAAGPAQAELVELPADPPAPVSVSPEPATNTLAERQALMRQPQQALRPLILTMQPLAETRQEIGTMRAGELCRKISPLVWPELRQRKRTLAPEPSQLALAASRALASFDYDAEAPGFGQALAVQRQTGGPLLQLQLASLQLDACAPDNWASTRAYEPQALESFHFRRHMVDITVDWTLQATDGKRLFRGQTRSRGGSLQHDSALNEAYRHALEQAVMQLLGNPDFQAALQQAARSAAAAPRARPAPPEPDHEAWVPSSWLPQSWQRRSSLAAILATMAQIKVPMTEYYLNEGQWPVSFEQMQLEVAPSVHGATLMLQPGGVLVAHLPAQFGAGKTLRLRAPDDPTVIGAAWTCETNADERPETCTSL